MKFRWLMWIPLILLCFLGGIWLNSLTQPKDDFVRSALVGKKLPAFSLPPAVEDIEGLSQSDFIGGKPRLLNFFGSWCAPCKAEAPFLEELQEKGVEIHGIALRDTPEDVARFLEQYGNPFARIGADRDTQTQILFGSTAVPESYIIASDGTILYQHIGDIRAEHVPMILEKIRAAK